MKTPKEWAFEYLHYTRQHGDTSVCLEEFIKAIQHNAIASAQEEVKHWQYVADTVYERWLDTRAKLNTYKMKQQELDQMAARLGEQARNQFFYEEIVYATKDLDVLENILKRNNNVISSSLEVALEEDLFPTVPALLKSAFIVRECERIISGAPRPEGERLKTFEFRRTPRPDA